MKGVILCFCLISLALAQDDDTIRVDFPIRKWVKPGDSFELECSSENGIDVEIYSPGSDPTPEELEERNDEAKEKESDSAYKGLQFNNASKEEHAGFYTCVGFSSGKQYGVARCEVIIVDLCADSDCLEEYHEECVGDYETGTYECKCPDCQTDSGSFAPICTDLCNTRFHDCHMRAENCKNRANETKLQDGTCPRRSERRTPTLQRLPSVTPIDVEQNQGVTLSAGVANTGNPPGRIEWLYSATADGERQVIEGADKDILTFDFTDNSVGYYYSQVIYCGEPFQADAFIVRGGFTTTPPAPLTGRKPVCSLFPGGVVENFVGDANTFDLACTHVLAGDVLPGGSYLKPWFVYGSFDLFNGKPALSGFTYHGEITFQILRGWIINLDGQKFTLEEGVESFIGDSSCTAIFQNYYLTVSCGGIKLHYDGIMAGMIELPEEREFQERDNPPPKPAGGLGLCWDNENGGRPNWQLGRNDNECSIDEDLEECTDEAVECDKYSIVVNDDDEADEAYSSCSSGAIQSCDELGCGDDEADEMQTCALERASVKTCELRGFVFSADPAKSCPEDPCEWKKDVAARGCPQENLPFICE